MIKSKANFIAAERGEVPFNSQRTVEIFVEALVPMGSAYSEQMRPKKVIIWKAPVTGLDEARDFATRVKNANSHIDLSGVYTERTLV